MEFALVRVFEAHDLIRSVGFKVDNDFCRCSCPDPQHPPKGTLVRLACFVVLAIVAQLAWFIRGGNASSVPVVAWAFWTRRQAQEALRDAQLPAGELVSIDTQRVNLETLK